MPTLGDPANTIKLKELCDNNNILFYIRIVCAIYLFYLGIFSTILCPLQYFIYDRYSTFVRWIKEEGIEINKIIIYI